MDEGDLSTLNVCPSLMQADYLLLYKCVILYYNDTLSEKPYWCNNERVLILGGKPNGLRKTDLIEKTYVFETSNTNERN
jgi:hypothetical protein